MQNCIHDGVESGGDSDIESWKLEIYVCTIIAKSGPSPTRERFWCKINAIENNKNPWFDSGHKKQF